jgi:hypothetical protein
MIKKKKKKGTEIQPMRNAKAEVIPVLIWVTGTISQQLRKYVSNIPEKHEIKELQKQPYWALYK